MFGKKKEIEVPIRPAVVEEPTVEIPKVEEPVKPATSKPQTVIAEDVVMVGNFETREPIVLLGKLKGNIHSTDSLSITKTGSLVGEAAVSALSSDGRIEGSILCSNTAEFGSMARMRGNLSTAALKTADGSSFEGKLTMITKQAEEEVDAIAEAFKDTVGENAEEFADSISDAVEEKTEELAEISDAIEEKAEEFADGISDAVEEKAEEFADGISDAVEEKAEEFTDSVSEAAEEIVEDAQDISQEILAGAEDVVEGAKDTFEAAAGEARETVNKFSWN